MNENGEYRINTIGEYLKRRFGRKIVKLSLDGGFTCPNRDGSKGTGGCIFCSADGSGEFASRTDADGIKGAVREQIRLLSDKWPNAGYIAYFQSHTNTYADVTTLREKFTAALACGEEGENAENIVGLAIATRPDCLDDSVCNLLAELNEKTFLWVELGLQTAFDDTAALINRCYPLSVYDDAVRKLSALGIRVVTHLIFGLPGESREQMLESVKYVCRPLADGSHIFGVKLHLLNVVRSSRMETLYPGYVPFASPDEYIELVCDALELIPPEITIHRLTADAKRNLLIAPEWSYKKRTILNGIQKRLAGHDTRQGVKYESSFYSSGPILPSL